MRCPRSRGAEVCGRRGAACRCGACAGSAARSARNAPDCGAGGAWIAGCAGRRCVGRGGRKGRGMRPDAENRGVSLRSVCRVGGTKCAGCAGLRRRGCRVCRLRRTAVRRPRRSERARYAAGCGKPRRVVAERVPGRRHRVRGMRRIAAQGVHGLPAVPDGGAAMLDEVRRPARTVGATEERTDEAYCRMRRHGTGQARTAN